MSSSVHAAPASVQVWALDEVTAPESTGGDHLVDETILEALRELRQRLVHAGLLTLDEASAWMRLTDAGRAVIDD